MEKALWADTFHNSRDSFFRSPTGAVPCGTSIRLRLYLDNETEFEPVVRLWKDGERLIPMAKTDVSNVPAGLSHSDSTLWEVEIKTPESPCLFWYYFIIGDSQYYGNAPDTLGGEGTVWDYEPPSYQITVYDPEYKTPEWLRTGVMYQIFVDRFRNGQSELLNGQTGESDDDNAYSRATEAGIDYPLLSYVLDQQLKNPIYIKRRHDVVIHKDWYEPPFLVPDESGDNAANDFFGGNLLGIIEKLDYLKSLGVTVIYLNPIFKAYSNHKYDTGDYHSIDPMYGNKEDFSLLCQEAEKKGMRVIIDGVFSHTGADSIYFNKYGKYKSLGAYQSNHSDYAKWYTFANFPDDYSCWWDVKSLPETNELEPSFLDFIVKNENAVTKTWIRRGSSGWRLDVADELPMEFLRILRKNIKSTNNEAALIGEVWEDASNKVSYGFMRSYTLGDTLDSVMNYPLRDYAIRFLLGHFPSTTLMRHLDALYENYPREFSYSLMNVIGTHDRSRILNILGEYDVQVVPKSEWREAVIPEENRLLGKKRLKLMLSFVSGMPGIPCVYYGDEAGVTGLADPFNRSTFPWGREDTELQDFFKDTLLRKHTYAELRTGDLKFIAPHDDVIGIIRSTDGVDVFGKEAGCASSVVLINRGGDDVTVAVSADDIGAEAIMGADGRKYAANDGEFLITLPSLGAIFARDGKDS